jgi:hypothetical protein
LGELWGGAIGICNLESKEKMSGEDWSNGIENQYN